MNKTDLISAVYHAVGDNIKKSQVGDVVDALFDVIANALAAGDEVRCMGFGTFYVSKRAASEGRNPRSGEVISIPSSLQPKFKAGKILKESVNK